MQQCPTTLSQNRTNNIHPRLHVHPQTHYINIKIKESPTAVYISIGFGIGFLMCLMEDPGSAGLYGA